ncbi:hypothetical protein [Nocardia gipuzkoensis]|uniref:hypothetical protein n=1 Tax=Nocardia gipuzkoensis TaxID=2749991 RepID=UPI00245868B0|nr:hypothetical protein [Nocardia gipuzkoensis]
MFTPVRPKQRIGEINFYSCTPTTKDESFGRAIEGIADTLSHFIGTRTDSTEFAGSNRIHVAFRYRNSSM